MGGAQPRQEDDGSSCNINIADAAITSPFFWAFVHLVGRVAEVLSKIELWAEGCVCHDRDPELEGPSRHRRMKHILQKVGLPIPPGGAAGAPVAPAIPRVRG